MTEQAISPLRRRVMEDMTMRKFAQRTQHDYLQRVKDFASYLADVCMAIAAAALVLMIVVGLLRWRPRQRLCLGIARESAFSKTPHSASSEGFSTTGHQRSGPRPPFYFRELQLSELPYPTQSGIKRFIAAFPDAAKRTDRIGFDMMEIHAQHGLIHNFLSPFANKRTYEYCGSLRGRT
jgi:hypothetical protein